MIDDAHLAGLRVFIALPPEDEAYAKELHQALDGANDVLDIRSVPELLNALRGVTDPAEQRTSVIVAGLGAAQDISRDDFAQRFPLLLIAEPGHEEEYLRVVKDRHDRFESLRKKDAPDRHKLLRSLSLLTTHMTHSALQGVTNAGTP